MAMVVLIFCFGFFAAVPAGICGLQNMAVVVGNRVTMTCDFGSITNYSVNWDQTPVQSNDGGVSLRKVNDGHKIMDGFTEFSVVGPNPGQTLLLNGAQTKHAGLYRCAAEGRKFTAQLIVLTTQPNCSFTFNRSHLNVRCEVEYSGNWIPTMQLLKMTANDEKPTTVAKNDCEKDKESRFAAVTSTDFISSLKSVSGFTFKANFADSSCARTGLRTNVTDYPNYKYSLKMPIQQLFDAPSNLMVNPLKDLYDPSDILKCEANSKVDLDFEWRDENSKILYGSPVLLLSDLSISKEQFIISCRAVNRLSGKYIESSRIIINVNRYLTNTGGGSVEATIGGESETVALFAPSETVALFAPYLGLIYASVGVVAVSAALVFTVVLCKKRKRRTSNQGVDASANALPMTTLQPADASDQPDDQLTSPEPTSIEGHDDTEGVCGTYEDIDLNTVTALSTSVGVNAGTLHSGDSSSREGSIGNIGDSSSDSNSSKKRNRYEELLERSPIVKRIYRRLKRSQKEQDTQTTNSSASCNESSVTESPVYINSLQANTTK